MMWIEVMEMVGRMTQKEKAVKKKDVAHLTELI